MYNKTFQREINVSGEPTSQVITNWDATRGTLLARGEPQETSLLGLKSNRLYHNRVSLMIPQCSLTCSALP